MLEYDGSITSQILIKLMVGVLKGIGRLEYGTIVQLLVLVSAAIVNYKPSLTQRMNYQCYVLNASLESPSLSRQSVKSIL